MIYFKILVSNENFTKVLIRLNRRTKRALIATGAILLSLIFCIWLRLGGPSAHGLLSLINEVVSFPGVVATLSVLIVVKVNRDNFDSLSRLKTFSDAIDRGITEDFVKRYQQEEAELTQNLFRLKETIDSVRTTKDNDDDKVDDGYSSVTEITRYIRLNKAFFDMLFKSFEKGYKLHREDPELAVLVVDYRPEYLKLTEVASRISDFQNLEIQRRSAHNSLFKVHISDVQELEQRFDHYLNVVCPKTVALVSDTEPTQRI